MLKSIVELVKALSGLLFVLAVLVAYVWGTPYLFSLLFSRDYSQSATVWLSILVVVAFFRSANQKEEIRELKKVKNLLGGK